MGNVKMTLKEQIEQLEALEGGGNIFFLSQFGDLDNLVQGSFKEMRTRPVAFTLIIAEESSKDRVNDVIDAATRLNNLVNTERPEHEVHITFMYTDGFIELSDDLREKGGERVWTY